MHIDIELYNNPTLYDVNQSQLPDGSWDMIVTVPSYLDAVGRKALAQFLIKHGTEQGHDIKSINFSDLDVRDE